MVRTFLRYMELASYLSFLQEQIKEDNIQLKTLATLTNTVSKL